jgi:DNA-binding MarR family transcriptional regulator
MAETETPKPAARARKKRLSKATYEGLAGFRLALRRFLDFSDAAASSAGITSQQYQAMLTIKASAGAALTIKEIAEQMLLVPNGAVQLMDRLAAQELVARTDSTTDRRSVIVTLTPKGDELLERLASDHLAELILRRPLLAESLRRLKRIEN